MDLDPTAASFLPVTYDVAAPASEWGDGDGPLKLYPILMTDVHGASA